MDDLVIVGTPAYRIVPLREIAKYRDCAAHRLGPVDKDRRGDARHEADGALAVGRTAEPKHQPHGVAAVAKDVVVKLRQAARAPRRRSSVASP